MLTRFPTRSHRRVLNHLFCLIAVSISIVSANAQNSVVMRHNDNARTGFYNDAALTAANVTPSQFGKLFSLPVDGELYAQPLYIANLAIPGKGTRNVIYAATAHNSVYAYDADDPNQTAPLWKVNFGPSVPASLVNNTSLPVEVGIISTPAIDATTGTMYVCNKDYFNSKQVFHLHALDIATGAEKPGSPIAITATVNGTGDGNDGAGHVPFFTDRQNQRAAVTSASPPSSTAISMLPGLSVPCSILMRYSISPSIAKRFPTQWQCRHSRIRPSGLLERNTMPSSNGVLSRSKSAAQKMAQRKEMRGKVFCFDSTL